MRSPGPGPTTAAPCWLWRWALTPEKSPVHMRVFAGILRWFHGIQLRYNPETGTYGGFCWDSMVVQKWGFHVFMVRLGLSFWSIRQFANWKDLPFDDLPMQIGDFHYIKLPKGIYIYISIFVYINWIIKCKCSMCELYIYNIQYTYQNQHMYSFTFT